MSETRPVVFPVPQAPAEPLSKREIASVLRTNVLAGFGRQAFEDDVVVSRLFSFRQILLNRADSIRHVLVDNADNYRRSRATIRLLHPITGTGLFLADGDDWRDQRRSVAPAFAPRMIPLLTQHIALAADAMVAELSASKGEVDLSDRMAHLALEIAGRSMFSLEMSEFGPRCAVCCANTASTSGGQPCWTFYCRWRSRRLAILAAGNFVVDG